MSIRDAASEIAARHLNEECLSKLRASYFNLRTRLYPLMRWAYGTFGVDELREHLEQTIGRDFDILMVHSSVNHMKPMFTGTPLDLVKMLIDYCGPDRTLVMPAFYFGEPGSGGALATFRQNPRFDLRRTPSQMGLATELFRRWKGVQQSRHPVYRVSALGPLAAALTAGHEFTSSPAGAGSPFDFMASHQTLVIGIGKPVEVLTQAHHCEAIMGNDFPVPRDPVEPLDIILVDGNEEIPFRLAGLGLRWRFNIWKIRKLMAAPRLREWTFHRVPLFAARAEHVTHDLIAAARRGLTLYDEA